MVSSEDRDTDGKVPDEAPRCPIDLRHLGRQTQGDAALEREVLALMASQIDVFRQRIGAAEHDELGQIAHALKGAAGNVGAFALAEAAEAVEAMPDDGDALVELRTEMARCAAFIAGLLA